MIVLISIISGLLPLILFCFFCLKKSSKELKVIFFYVTSSFLVDYFTSRTRIGMDHIYLFLSVFTILEYFSFITFLYLCISNKIVKKATLFFSVLYVGYLILNYIQSYKNTEDFDSIQASVESILIIILCIIYLYEQIDKPQDYFIYSSPNFWVILGFLSYMAGTLFLFITSNSISFPERHKFWFINNICNIFKNILFSIAFIINYFNYKNPPIGRPYDTLLEEYEKN